MDLGIILQVVIVFGVIVFVHELGHFLAAKAVGVGVERFSLGFGPKVFGKQIGETEYLLSAIPLGGYVKMIGEEVGEETPETDVQRSFSHQSLSRRFLIVFAGPLFNIITAFFVFSLTFLSFGEHVPLDIPKIGGVVPDLPAQKAGLEVGDEVLSVTGIPVKTWAELAEKIQGSEGKETVLLVRKGKDQQTTELLVKPELRDDLAGGGAAKYAIGITPASEVKSVALGRAVVLGAQQTWFWIQLIFQSLVMFVTGGVSAKELGGPILIAQEASRQARLGLDYLLRFTGIINVNLAVFNLLPVPVLDGGYLLFFTIEAILGRPPSTRSREMALRVGFLLIITLIVFVVYNDIARLVG
jgi:regulator of sigma E protease